MNIPFASHAAMLHSVHQLSNSDRERVQIEADLNRQFFVDGVVGPRNFASETRLPTSSHAVHRSFSMNAITVGIDSQSQSPLLASSMSTAPGQTSYHVRSSVINDALKVGRDDKTSSKPHDSRLP